MQGFYNITTVIKNQLLQDPFCNTVTIGDLFEVDLRKQTIFPLSHIIVNSADLESNVWRFNMSVISMDIVDKSKELTTDHFTGNDNEHDVLNTQHAVLNRLLEVLRRGSLYEEHYHLDGNPSLEPFTERFENYLAGWTATFDVLIPNDMTACDGFETPTVICENGVVTIKDSEDNVLYTLNVPSGGTLNQEIQDSTYLVEYLNGTPIESGSIPAEGSVVVQVPDPIVCADATYRITNDELNVLYSGTIPSGGNLDQVIQDSTAVLKNTDNTTLSTTSINAEGSEDIIAPDGHVHLKKENDGSIDNVFVPSGTTEVYIVENNDISVNGVFQFDIHATEDLDIRLRNTSNGVVPPVSVTELGNHATIVIPDTDIEVNGVAEGSVVAGATVDIQLSDSGGTVTPTSVTQVGNDFQIILPDAPPAVTRSTATLMKTGQTTSYRTGDDGDIEAGRATNFLTLDAAPVHNNGTATINTTTNRFTDTLGGQTYANNIVLDWSTWNGSTLLGWYRVVNGINVTWNAAIDGALALSVGSFTSGWRLPNVMEFSSILNWGLTSYLNYSPFNLGGLSFQTSTTWGFTTTNNITLSTTGFPGISVKTNASGRFVGVRIFSLSTSNVLS